MSCQWTDDYDGVWHTDCGHAFAFTADGPALNGFAFCPFCGEVLIEQPIAADEED